MNKNKILVSYFISPSLNPSTRDRCALAMTQLNMTWLKYEHGLIPCTIKAQELQSPILKPKKIFRIIRLKGQDLAIKKARNELRAI